MRVAFFGASGAFDYYKVGGTESFARRLAAGLRARGHGADFVVYRAPTPHRRILPAGVGLYYFGGLTEALAFLRESYDQVITMYLPFRDRLSYARFRVVYREGPLFHQVYFSWPGSALKRAAAFLDGRLYPFSGRLFCISPRLWRRVRRWSDRAVLLLPPVPAGFFLEPAGKPVPEKIRVAYIGRLETGKGLLEVLQLFEALTDYPELELTLAAYGQPRPEAGVPSLAWLSQQPHFRFSHTPYEGHTPEVDLGLTRLLQDTDILLLPYRDTAGTIDTPLLLLEGMASLCAVVSRDQENLREIYGPSGFFRESFDNIESLKSLVLGARQHLQAEKQRIYRRNQELPFRLEQVVINLLAHLN